MCVNGPFLNKHYDDLIKLDKKMRNPGGAPEADASPDDGGSMAAASGEK